MTTTSLFVWLGWTLAGLGSLLAAWALFWNRARGRKRCPKCWYDMAGAASFPATCPECGRVVRRERGLSRTRRRWVFACIGLSLAAPGSWTMAHYEVMRQRGWVAAVPSDLLVRIAPLAQQSYPPPTFAGLDRVLYEELTHRLTDGDIPGRVAAAYLNRHCKANPGWARRTVHIDRPRSADASPRVAFNPPWFVYRLRYAFDVHRVIGPEGDGYEVMHSQARRFYCGNAASMHGSGRMTLGGDLHQAAITIELVRDPDYDPFGDTEFDQHPERGTVIWRRTVPLSSAAPVGR